MIGGSLSEARNRAVSAVGSVPAWVVVLSTVAVVGAAAAVLAAVVLSRGRRPAPVDVPTEEAD
jgi:hypothetical protein